MNPRNHEYGPIEPLGNFTTAELELSECMLECNRLAEENRLLRAFKEHHSDNSAELESAKAMAKHFRLENERLKQALRILKQRYNL